MREILTILNDYRNGTPEVRLNLFLFHRDLRHEFNEIENEESAALNVDKKGFSPFPRNKKRSISPIRIFNNKYQSAG